jgi:ParB/RepB/Spo0J family partition protein
MSNTTNTKNVSAQGAPDGYELREIPLERIVPAEMNPRQRFDQGELERLEHAISSRGFDHPILVRASEREGYFEIIDGERRFRAAQAASLEKLPALVKAGESAPGSDLLDAMLANGLGVSLDVVEEAAGYAALIDAGYTRKGIAEAFKIPLARVRERLTILELPERLREQVAAGVVPLMAVKALVSVHKIHPELAAIAAKRVLDGPPHQWDGPTTWEELAADPISVVIGSYAPQLDDLPADVFVAGESYPVSGFSLDEEASAALVQLCELRSSEPERFEVRFAGELVDQALALGAAHRSANERQALIAGSDVASQLAADYIRARLKAERERSRKQGQIAKPGEPPEAAGEARRGAERQPSEEEKTAAREEGRRMRDQTIASNQRLGAALLKHVCKVKVDERVLKILAAVPLAHDFARIAARGARLAFPGWAELETLKNGSTKAIYPPEHEAEAKAREFLCGATSAAEIAGRTLALLAAARWASEEHAIARSNASGYELELAPRFIVLDSGVPWRSEAGDLLDEILIEKLPPDVTKPIREAREARDARRAEEERRERERDTVIAAFVDRAPGLSKDERQAEIQRLRGEYGLSALPLAKGRELMELPEPAPSEA